MHSARSFVLSVRCGPTLSDTIYTSHTGLCHCTYGRVINTARVTSRAADTYGTLFWTFCAAIFIPSPAAFAALFHRRRFLHLHHPNATNVDNTFIYRINSPISIRNSLILYILHHPKFLESSRTSRDRSIPWITAGALSRPRWPHTQSLACWEFPQQATCG